MKKLFFITLVTFSFINSYSQTAKDYFDQGNNNYEHQDYKEAIKDYDKAIDLEPKYVDAYRNRGNAKSFLKDYAGAAADFKKLVEITPAEIPNKVVEKETTKPIPKNQNNGYGITKSIENIILSITKETFKTIDSVCKIVGGYAK